jgi:cytochrome c biogenesis protein ResB
MNGYNNSIVVIPQGGSAEIAGFILKLNDFSINYYSDGSISEYKAMVSIIDGTTVENYDITVNDPLIYKGLTFYLYDYDSVGVAQSGKASWVAFQIKSEAGVPFIWAGAFTTIAGIMVALYIPHKRIWIKESNGGLLLGGDSNKRSRSFLTDMEKIRRAAVGDFNHASSKIKRA